MHEEIRNQLEEYLEGPANRSSLERVRRHLERCESCRQEAEQMRQQAELLRSLRAEEELAPLPGFYARVLARVEAQRRLPVLAAFLDPGFGRRLIFASLAAAIGFGSYLIYAERKPALELAGPVGFLAAQASPGEQVGGDPERDRQTMLLAVASYQE
jgi:anti-sigma factor RsiW